MMRENETDYFKVMAKGVDNLFLLDQVIDTIARWIYVEEIISEPTEEQNVAIVFARSNDFGCRF